MLMDVNLDGTLLAALAAICWALEAILVKKGETSLNSVLGAAVGTISTGVVFTAYLLLTNNLKTAFFSDSTIYFLLAGIFALILGRVFYFLAINKTGVSMAVAISATYPMIAVILSFLLFKEPISLRTIAGITMVTIGVIVLLI